MTYKIEDCVKRIRTKDNWYKDGVVVYHYPGDTTHSNEEIYEIVKPLTLSKEPKEALERIIKLHEEFNAIKLSGRNWTSHTVFDINSSIPGCLRAQSLLLAHTIYAFFEDTSMGNKIDRLIKQNWIKEKNANILCIDKKPYVVLKKPMDNPEIYFSFLNSETIHQEVKTYEYFYGNEI